MQYGNGDTQSYTHDPMGNRLTKVSNGTTTTYGYDDLDRMTTLNGVANSFDKNGNMLSLGTGSNLPDTFVYDQENRPIRTGPCRGDVNANSAVNSGDFGILSSKYGTESSTAFDLLADMDANGTINAADLALATAENNKQCRSTGANTGSGRNWYNGDGLRVRERTYFPTQTYVNDDYIWDVGASLPVMLQDVRTPNSGAASTTTFLYGLGLISLTNSATGVTSYPLGDALGSTSQLANSSGTITDTASYDVFGAVRSSTGTTANPFDFAGEQSDHNVSRGLQYLRARFYDPSLGRFLLRDPLPFAQRYAYAGDDSGECDGPEGAVLG